MKRPLRQYKRSARVNRLLQEEIADIIGNRLRDPRIGFVSVIRVETTEDLRSSKVYISVLDESKGEETLQTLMKAVPMIRRELRPRLHTRRIPAIKFIYDDNIAYSIRLSRVIEDLKTDEREEENHGE